MGVGVYAEPDSTVAFEPGSKCDLMGKKRDEKEEHLVGIDGADLKDSLAHSEIGVCTDIVHFIPY
jgi:hypothetical protein